jgi:hypothetical protein
MVLVSSRCPTCGDTCPPDAVFCISCGASLAQPATSTTRLLRQSPARRLWRRPPGLARPRKSIGEQLVIGGVAAFGLSLLTLLLLVAYVGSYTPGLDPVGWLFVLAGAIHLVRGVRRREALVGMRYATLCAALPFAQVTQAFVTTTLLFGGAAGLLMIIQFLVSVMPRPRWRP